MDWHPALFDLGRQFEPRATCLGTVREKVIDYLRKHQPEALTRIRSEVRTAGPL